MWPFAKKLYHGWISTMTSSNEIHEKLPPPKWRAGCAPGHHTFNRSSSVEITRHAHSTIACSRHVYQIIGAVLRIHRFRGASHMRRRSGRAAATIENILRIMTFLLPLGAYCKEQCSFEKIIEDIFWIDSFLLNIWKHCFQKFNCF